MQGKLLDDAVDMAQAPQVLAIENVEEGEPEDVWPGGRAESAKSGFDHKWGPFIFSHVEREVRRRGGAVTVTSQWQVTCPLEQHSDPGDADGTQCKKTLGFEGDSDREEAARILRHWCVLGFDCTSRACGENSHLSALRGRQLKGMDFVSDARLEEILATKMDEWHENDPEPMPQLCMDSGSESSSSSDTSSDS